MSLSSLLKRIISLLGVQIYNCQSFLVHCSFHYCSVFFFSLMILVLKFTCYITLVNTGLLDFLKSVSKLCVAFFCTFLVNTLLNFVQLPSRTLCLTDEFNLLISSLLKYLDSFINLMLCFLLSAFSLLLPLSSFLYSFGSTVLISYFNCVVWMTEIILLAVKYINT